MSATKAIPFLVLKSPMKSSLNILIVEDELLIAEMLKEMLQDLGHTVGAKARSFNEAMEHLQRDTAINFAFLDINLGKGKTGLDIAREIRTKQPIPFIFLTSYADKKTIQEAIEHKPEAYLIKPFSQADLLATLEIVRARKTGESFFTFKSGYEIIKLKTSDIRWLKSDNVYVELKTIGKTHLLRMSLDKVLTELNNDQFIRVHRSYAVNLLHVEAVNSQHIVIGQEKIPLARNHHEAFLNRFR